MTLSAVFWLLPLLACLGLTLAARSAKAAEDVENALLDGPLMALPFPVVVVDVQSMRLYASNDACLRSIGPDWCPPTPLADLFIYPAKVRDFITLIHQTAHQDDGEEITPEEKLRRHSLPCLQKTLDGFPHPLILSLFFIEERSPQQTLFFFAVKSAFSTIAGNLGRVFDKSPEMIALRNRDGKVMLCNDAFKELCGKELAQVLGKTLPQLDIPPMLTTLLCAHDKDVLATGRIFSSETDGVIHGKRFCFENVSYPDIARDGFINGIFNVCRDVTDAQKVADALQRQGALLQATNDAALLLFSDEEELDDLASRTLGMIGAVTKADLVDVWRNHGSSEDGLLCTMVYSWNKDYSSGLFSPQSHTAAYNTQLPGWEERLSLGECVNTLKYAPSEQEKDFLAQQGLKAALVAPVIFRASFWGFIRLGVHDDNQDWSKAEETILRSVGLLLAATIQRRQIQEALAESEERFRDVTMAAGEIVWELNDQGYFSYISERVFAFTGYLPEEILGRRWEDLAVDASGEEITGRMFQASAATGSFRALEHKIKNKSGQTIWLFTSGKLLIGPDGIAGLRGASLDVSHDKQTSENLNTTLKALEHANRELELAAERALEFARRAESASKAKSEFLANMSHEVRTPLNAIIGMAYLMQKTNLSVRQEDYINKIHAAGQTLLGVVNDILDFSKIESGKLEIEHVSFELESLLENLASLLGAKIEEKGLFASFSIRRNVPRRVFGDPLRIGQVLTNLVSNAVKFTQQGAVTLVCSLDSLENKQARLRFVVQDTGIGISEKQQSLLFQSFSQVDSSITRKYGGTGLGLVIAKNLLALSGGILELESRQGQGTTITALLPLDVDDTAPERSGAEDERLANLSVIVVETSESQREQYLTMLDDLGCRVAAFVSMGEAFAAIASEDETTSSPRVLMLPLAFVEEGNGKNITHMREDMRLSNIPRVLAIAPFGFVEGADGGNVPAFYQDVRFITRPLLSTSLRTALMDIAASTEHSPKAAEARQAGPSAPYFPESRILLVEDNPINQQIATELLLETGVSVTVADNGRIAVELLENSEDLPFDLVFMDLQMPEMDGFTATERIRANPRLAFLPIIAMTAHATVDERNHCLEAGMNEHISKPIDVETVFNTLRGWLTPAHRQKALFEAIRLDDSPPPSLPGVNTDKALGLMHNDTKLHKASLLRFLLCHTNALSAFDAALKQNDMRRMLHLISSLLRHARLIGADPLANAAEPLEAALGQAQRPDMQNILVFREELTALLQTLRREYPEPSDKEETASLSNADMESLLHELSMLNSFLADDDAAACPLFAKIEPLLKTINGAGTNTAAKALAVFDFSLALSVLSPMEKNLAEALAAATESPN